MRTTVNSSITPIRQTAIMMMLETCAIIVQTNQVLQAIMDVQFNNAATASKKEPSNATTETRSTPTRAKTTAPIMCAAMDTYGLEEIRYASRQDPAITIIVLNQLSNAQETSYKQEIPKETAPQTAIVNWIHGALPNVSRENAEPGAL